MICPACRTEVAERSLFCSGCGRRVSGRTPLKTGLASASFVLGILGLIPAVILNLLFASGGESGGAYLYGMILLMPTEVLGILGLAMGISALLLLRSNPGRYGGRQQAITGIICAVLNVLATGSMFLVGSASEALWTRVRDAERKDSELKEREGPCEGLVTALTDASTADAGNAQRWLDRRGGRLPPPSCLCHAIYRRQDVVALWMIPHGMDINSRSCNGARWTPLETAISERRPGIVEQLIDHGADPNSAGPDIPPGLVWAAWRGDARLVHLLLAKGARTDVRSRASGTLGWTPLDAVMVAHDEPGADRRANPPVGSQALSDRLAIIDDLLDHGASPTDSNGGKSTPLHFAVSWGFVEGAQRLLERCAELRCNPSPLDVKDGRGRTPLERARAQPETQLIPTAIAQTDRMIATLEAWSRD